MAEISGVLDIEEVLCDVTAMILMTVHKYCDILIYQ